MATAEVVSPLVALVAPVEAPTGPVPVPVPPPVPQGLPRPPPAARAAPNPQYQAAAMHAAARMMNEQPPHPQQPALLPGFLPAFQQQPSWDWGPLSGHQAHPPMQQELPVISTYLMREADAWRALLSLHGSLMHLGTDLARSSLHEVEDLTEAFEQREASYVASVAQLASQCDLLVAEAIKIRGLRKAQVSQRNQGLQEVLQQHAQEGLAVGETQARNSAMAIASATSEIRQAAQALRTQLQQGRALLAAHAELQAVPAGVDPAATIVMGWVDSRGTTHDLRPVARVLEQVYQRGQLCDETLAAALWQGDLPAPAPPAQSRTFQRRAGSHVLQQELVAGAEGT